MTRTLPNEEIFATGSNNGVITDSRRSGRVREHVNSFRTRNNRRGQSRPTTAGCAHDNVLVRPRQSAERSEATSSRTRDVTSSSTSSFRPSGANTFQRGSPTGRHCSRSPTTGDTEHYAGAKFSGAPSANVLPRPPSHWLGSSF